jgi:hypothetical protein
MTLIERLEAASEPDWHDPNCPFQQHCYCDDSAPHDRVNNPLAKEAAAFINELLDALAPFSGGCPGPVTEGHLITAERVYRRARGQS